LSIDGIESTRDALPELVKSLGLKSLKSQVKIETALLLDIAETFEIPSDNESIGEFDTDDEDELRLLEAIEQYEANIVKTEIESGSADLDSLDILNTLSV
jgi:hypothetical protein